MISQTGDWRVRAVIVKHVVVAASALLLSAALSAMRPAPALAADDTPTPDAAVICTPHDSYADFTTTSKTYVITHAKAYENFSGGTVTRSVSTDLVTTVTASVTYSTSVKVTAGVVIADLEGSTGLSLQASGAVTKTASENITQTMSHQGTYIFYAGTRKATGSWDGAVCSGNGQYWSDSYGKATSWTIDIQGTVWCGGSRPGSGTLGYIAYGKYC